MLSYNQNVDGVTDVNRVTFEGKYNLSPSLSPDGKLLLFLTQENGKFRMIYSDYLNSG